MTTHLLAALLLSLVPGKDGIAWQPSLEGALATAREQHKPVLLAVNMDGERANDQMAAEVYGDPQVLELAARCVAVVASSGQHSAGEVPCPRFGAVTCREHRSVDAEARKLYLKADDAGEVIAPQHVLIAPDGKVILSVPYAIRADELAWCLREALVEVDRASAPPPVPGAHAPKRLLRGGVIDPTAAGEGSGGLLTREAALELIKELRKGVRGPERESGIRRLLRVDESEAVEFVRQELGQAGGARASGEARAGRVAQLVHRIGVVSPPRFWEVAADFATSADLSLRSEAAVALEQLAAPDSLKTVKSALRKEREPAVERLWLRALASVGAAESDARRAVLKEAAGAKDASSRANAIVALGWLETHPDVDAALTKLLDEGEGDARTAAVCAVGWTRQASWRERVEALRTGPGRDDEALGKACERALALLDGRGAGPLEESILPLTGDTIRRERFFPPAP